jgi:sulfur relay (sulfurtransferase) DsrC/TusE family protein
MAITVVGNQTVAGLSYVKIRAGVAVVDPVANVTYIAPVAGVSYIELVASAQIDTSGRYQFVPDLTVILDGLRFTLAKSLPDFAYAVDTTRYEFEKAVSGDSIALTEEFTKLLIFVRFFTDTFGLSEAQVLAVAKALQDSAVMSDAAAKQITKASSDTFALSDVTTKQLGKAIADTYGLTDVYRFSFVKTASDTTTASDAVARAFSKALADTFSLQDTEIFSLAKLLSDGVAMNDGFDAGDGAVYAFSKGISNVTMVSDATSRQSNKVTADTVTTADAGSLFSQSYCDITYFAEDYVGESRVF